MLHVLSNRWFPVFKRWSLACFGKPRFKNPHGFFCRLEVSSELFGGQNYQLIWFSLGFFLIEDCEFRGGKQ